MAAYTVTYAKHATLVASVVDTVTLNAPRHTVAVVNRGAGPIYFRLFTMGAAAPTVAGDETYVVGSGETKVVTSENPVSSVSLIAAGAEAYSVEAY